MKDIKTRVLIVGGGPAGTSVGLHLLKAGIDTIILDKASFPREKLCGGLITEPGMKALMDMGIDVTEPLFYRPSEVRFFDHEQEIFSYESQADYAVVDRLKFDDLMMSTYQMRGGRACLGERLVSINRQERYIVTSRGNRIHYKSLIGADGANSMVRKSLNKEQLKMAFCAESHVPKDKVQNYPGNGINVIFGKIDTGFAWSFEGQSGASVGIGGITDDHRQIIRDLEAIQSEGTIKGAFVPYGEVPKVCSDGDVFLVGDAAGHADPILGEGIAYALMAGSKILKVINSPRRDYTYEREFLDIKKTLIYGKAYQSFFFNKGLHQWFIRRFEKHPNLTRRLCEGLVMKGDLHYYEPMSIIRAALAKDG